MRENCCVMIITETWLHPLIPDAAVRLADRSIHRQDRNMDSVRAEEGDFAFMYTMIGVTTATQ